MIATVNTNGDVLLPAELVRQDGIAPGQEIEITRTEAGQYQILPRAGLSKPGLVQWLLSCPEKGFFVPIPSESTNDL
jgi:bifunctional DNA-binding transcriptional regulator/antitoxin component of YhaV-PrlF toxin-antitoxin module